ncbi:hypothetical protein BCR35DRAFT_309490 [Leucosporidium creatinivorum]|uniref:Homeodomain-like protein n=1 Tax=Leucosporidium creatinivorum TaxID=106004 RepID=A0A1Y2DGE7_9BASI|nr:hypothetical protein BCR35DRAFT_309490 [Leucosporidium creatinivorum]
MGKSDHSHNLAGSSPMSPEAGRLAKKARKKERKAARLAEAQQEELGGAKAEQKKEKKRKRSNSDAAVQDLLVPSQTPVALVKKNKKKRKADAAEPVEEPAAAVESSHKRKKHKHKHAEEDEPVAAPPSTAQTESPEERKKRKREKGRSEAAAAAATTEAEADAPVKEPAATTDAEEPSRKMSKKAKKHAAEQTADPLPTSDPHLASAAQTAESDAAREARKAEKKERKRLKAEAAVRSVVEEPEPQQPKASTSKLAEPPRRELSIEEQQEALFAAAFGASARKPASSSKVKEAASSSKAAPKASTSKVASVSKGKGKEKSVEKGKGKKKADLTEEQDAEAFKKLSRDDPATAISSRWLSLKQVKELAAEHNFKYRQGKFTLAEDKIITKTLEEYRETSGLTQAELKACILRDRKGKTKEDKTQDGDDLWPMLALAVGGGRPVLAVYNHVKRLYDPLVKGGPWTPEEDQALVTAVREHGTLWTKISVDVKRNPTDCRDRYTKHLKPAVPGKLKKGHWEAAEEEKLRQLVKKHGHSWKLFEKLMDGRTATQCRVKWCDSLAPKEAIKVQPPDEEDTKPPARLWSTSDRSSLIHAVADLKVKHWSEIDWEDIGDDKLERHGATNLRNRWRALRVKAEAKLGGDKGGQVTHSEVVDYLVACYPVRGSSAKARKVKHSKFKSAEFIESSSDEDEDEGAGAGSSDDEESD